MQSNETDSVTVYKIKIFGEKIVCVIVSTFLIFMFVDQLLLVDVFSQLCYLTYASQKTVWDFRYKSLKSRKIDNTDLIQQFSLSTFTDFRFQSIKITWLLPIFIDRLLWVIVCSGASACAEVHCCRNWKSIDARKFGYDKAYIRPSVQHLNVSRCHVSHFPLEQIVICVSDLLSYWRDRFIFIQNVGPVRSMFLLSWKNYYLGMAQIE